MQLDRKLKVCLLIMRLTFAAFIMIWAVEKVIAPDHAQRVFSIYYFTELPSSPLVVAGVM